MDNVDEFLDKFSFKGNQREEALHYVKVKGIYIHQQIIDLLGYTNETNIPWDRVKDMLRYDKKIRDQLYIYLATLEEYIRAYISNKYNYSNINTYIRVPNKYSSLAEYLDDLDLGHLINEFKKLPKEDKIEMFESLEYLEENLDSARVLRNKVSHHNFLFNVTVFEDCYVDRVKSNSLINQIKNLRQLLPEEYRYGKNGKGGITAAINKAIISNNVRLDIPEKYVIKI